MVEPTDTVELLPIIPVPILLLVPGGSNEPAPVLWDLNGEYLFSEVDLPP